MRWCDARRRRDRGRHRPRDQPQARLSPRFRLVDNRCRKPSLLAIPALAAAVACPDREVICVAGDGAFGINATERDDLVRHGAEAAVTVSNNAAWDTQRFVQELDDGGQVIGRVLAHAYWAAMARGPGDHAERVQVPVDLPAAIQRAAANAPALIDVVTSELAVFSDAKQGLGFVPDDQPPTARGDAERRRGGL